MAALDVVIRGARVVDGTGNPWSYGDILLRDDRILDVLPPGQVADSLPAHEVVDADGMVVCPGFIDILSHAHVPLMRDPKGLSKLLQGVTTEIMGEAWTPAPVGGRIRDSFRQLGSRERTAIADWIAQAPTWTSLRAWLDALVARGVSPNVGAFLGGGTIREYAKGLVNTPATTEELAVMRHIVEQAMEEGAFGVAYALIYPPDAFTDTAELVAICQVVSRHGGLYSTHLRSEADQLLEALEEAIAIGRQAQVPVEVYHLKASGRRNWPLMEEAVDRITAAREKEGIDITADLYPYAASGTGLDAVLPPWAAANGRLFDRLADPALRAELRQVVLSPREDGEDGWEAMARNMGPEAIMPVGFARPEHQQYQGKRLNEIAALRQQDWFEAVCDVLLAERQSIPTIYFSMDERNVVLGLRQPYSKIASDAGGVDPTWAQALGPVHPRAYGTFPRVLGRYVREQRVLTLEEAIHKMTGAVAARLRMPDRGVLRAGAYADVVILDPATVADTATFEQPHQLATGIRDVWVNGQRVVAQGHHTGALPGRVVTPHTTRTTQ